MRVPSPASNEILTKLPPPIIVLADVSRSALLANTSYLASRARAMGILSDCANTLHPRELARLEHLIAVALPAPATAIAPAPTPISPYKPYHLPNPLSLLPFPCSRDSYAKQPIAPYVARTLAYTNGDRRVLRTLAVIGGRNASAVLLCSEAARCEGLSMGGTRSIDRSPSIGRTEI